MTIVRSKEELSMEKWQSYLSEDKWPSFDSEGQEEIMGRFFDAQFPEEERTVRSTESVVPSTIGEGGEQVEAIQSPDVSGEEEKESVSSKVTDVCWTESETWETCFDPSVPWTQEWQHYVPEETESPPDLDQVPVRCYDVEDGVFQQAVLHSLSPGYFLPPFPHPNQLISGDYGREFPLDELLQVCSHPGEREPRCVDEILPSVEDNADNRQNKGGPGHEINHKESVSLGCGKYIQKTQPTKEVTN